MRLGQVKRTHNIETSKIVSFLNKKGIEISSHPNSKLTDDQLKMVLDEFKTEEEVVEEVVAEVVKKEDILVEEAPKAKKKTPAKKKKESKPEVGDVIEIKEEKPKKKKTEDEDEDIEVIRAPKQEVEGLKVLGKIDIPKPKVVEKTEEEVIAEEEKAIEEEKIANEPVEVDPLGHIHPTKRAKLKALEKENKIDDSKHSFVAKKKDKKEKSIAQKLEEEKKRNTKSKKKANPHRHMKKAGISAQRIEVTDDGTILPKASEETVVTPKKSDEKLGLFAKIWKWFNT